MTVPPSQQAAIEAHIKKDAYANYLGATIEAIEPGYSRVSLTVSEEQLNFHNITHGGLVFSLGDIAFAAASNSHGQTAVALNVSISFLKATYAGAHLIAEAKEQHMGGRTALYEITVTEKESGEVIARSQATVYRKRDRFVE